MGLITWLRGLFSRPKVLQVGMLCLRDGPEGPEVLLVKSLDSGRWILPKGWPMEGRSLAEAAAQEAWEEAGARGEVSPREIGRLSVSKRLDSGLELPSEMVVFEMRNTSLAESYPEAHKRERRFLPADQAAARADVQEIGDFIRDRALPGPRDARATTN